MKTQFIVFALYMLTLIGGCQESLTKSSAYPLLSKNEVQLIKEAEEIGRMIYEKDKFAAWATDLMFERVPNPNGGGIRGWITCKRGADYVVLFVSPLGDELMSPYQVVFKGQRHPQFIHKKRLLSEEEAAMFRARRHFMDIIKEPCSEKYNTVVLPIKNEDGWLVYALAATTNPQTIVVGGHYRATISNNGNDILSQRGFTKSCLNLSTDPSDMPSGAEPAAYTVSHLLDDVPTEIHVFLSLVYRKPFYVITRDDRLWRIEGDTIKLLKKNN
jgi:hypothetical protein